MFRCLDVYSFRYNAQEMIALTVHIPSCDANTSIWNDLMKTMGETYDQELVQGISRPRSIEVKITRGDHGRETP
jgi:hypothetical protein